MLGWIILGVIAFVLLWGVWTYNSLIRSRLQAENGWSQIDVQLKRRYDLIPNLVETCKGYMKHERETLEKVIQARNLGLAANGAKAQAQANNMLTDTLKSLFAVVENYPDLKANQNLLSLQEELTSTENKVGFARQFYNDMVMAYNAKRQGVPTNLIANLFRFQPKEYFEVTSSEEKQAPKVSFA